MKKEMFYGWFKKYNHFLILLYYVVIIIQFYRLEGSTAPRYYMHSRIDDYIPFVKEFIIPYALWFPYIAVTLIFFGFKSKNIFIKYCMHMFIGMTISYIIYELYPNGINLRPVLVEQDFFTNLVRYLYQIDTPTNSAPSIHVLNSIAVHTAIVNYKNFKNYRLVRRASFILAAAIIASTVCLKQHSVIDVFWGALISIVLYLAVYKVDYRGIFRQERKRLFE
ncbi:PAP2 superfamily protein [Anaerobacterium chartisolvens]|uniref:PAP2 superfamily protein n=1 Tax=Anaerobacterium chartisolvens TaxID=1297424 RepID=A0A369AVY7_9FIRM|nr:phosphatase PAP2 family protein [Anaerobacterium chartisolvens]RCX13479.1 PAP2 superfamily protein [Anaerobacterium chartisolvens]